MPANDKPVKKKKKNNRNAAVDHTYFHPNMDDDEMYDYLTIAHQLGYPQSVKDAIRAAKSDLECERILKDARNKC